MVTLTAAMFNRTITTEHVDLADARQRVAKIAAVQQCRIEGTETEGVFVLQVWAGDLFVDDPRVDWTYGRFVIAEGVAA